VSSALSYIVESTALSTRRTYTAGIKSYELFCRRHNISEPYPSTDVNLLLWFTWLAQKSKPVQAKSMKVYLAGVVSFHERIGYANLMSDKPLTLRAWMGIRRTQGEQVKRTRIPITTQVLRERLQPHLPLRTHLGRLVWATCCLATCGLFRCGELCINKQGDTGLLTHQMVMYDRSDQVVPWNDVDNRSRVARLAITLLQSKTDPWRKGVTIQIAHPLAIRAWVEYLQSLPQALAPLTPLLQHRNGAALTRTTFVDQVRRALSRAGVRAKEYAGHSFRRGGATSLRLAGVPDSLIQLLGRWKSDAFRTYIEPSLSMILDAGKRM
jgi:hypothetical protein